MTERLKNLSVYVTYTRLMVLEILCAQKKAVTISDILNLSSERLDRITVYRALQIFLEKGIVFAIRRKTDMGYFLSDGLPDDKMSEKTNVSYFRCIKCGQITLLNSSTPIQDNRLEGFDILSSNIVFEGYCPKCQRAGQT